jgi:hypothetical protein
MPDQPTGIIPVLVALQRKMQNYEKIINLDIKNEGNISGEEACLKHECQYSNLIHIFYSFM